MISLGLDSSSKAVSAAIFDGSRLLWEGYLNGGRTHTQTLMPLLSGGLDFCGLTIDDINKIYYTEGPGSFTGLRIAMAAVKGLCLGREIEVKGISTLYATAHNLSFVEGSIFTALDARASQVYGALFSASGGIITRVTDDNAIMVSELADIIPEGCYIVGDGTELVMTSLGEKLKLRPAPEPLRFQRASFAVVAGMNDEKEYTTAEKAGVNYIRLPQAQRERLKKLEENK